MAQRPLSRAPALDFYLWLGIFFSKITHLLSQYLKKEKHPDFVHFCFHIQESLQSTCTSRCCIWNCWQSLFYTNWTIWPLVLFVKVQCIYAWLLQSARECQKGPAFAEPWVIANFSRCVNECGTKAVVFKRKKGSVKLPLS